MIDPFVTLCLVALAAVMGFLVGVVYERDRTDPPSGRPRK